MNVFPATTSAAVASPKSKALAIILYSVPDRIKTSFFDVAFMEIAFISSFLVCPGVPIPSELGAPTLIVPVNFSPLT